MMLNTIKKVKEKNEKYKKRGLDVNYNNCLYGWLRDNYKLYY